MRSAAYAWLLALDKFGYATGATIACKFGLGPVPLSDETISSCVGRRANAGQRWALIAQTVIDRLFVLVGRKPGHCQRSIIKRV